jgi:aflatoxin B1 aldehyde reductase
MTGAAIVWLAHHSALSGGDGIILGVSNMEQLKQNLQFMESPALPEAIAAEYGDVWELVKGRCPKYFRP